LPIRIRRSEFASCATAYAAPRLHHRIHLAEQHRASATTSACVKSPHGPRRVREGPCGPSQCRVRRAQLRLAGCRLLVRRQSPCRLRTATATAGASGKPPQRSNVCTVGALCVRGNRSAVSPLILLRACVSTHMHPSHYVSTHMHPRTSLPAGASTPETLWRRGHPRARPRSRRPLP
jgi:hypothetical protein